MKYLSSEDHIEPFNSWIIFYNGYVYKQISCPEFPTLLSSQSFLLWTGMSHLMVSHNQDWWNFSLHSLCSLEEVVSSTEYNELHLYSSNNDTELFTT